MEVAGRRPCHDGVVIVVAGEALVDRVAAPDGSVSDALGGAPYNVARALARLGVDVEFAGAVSTDALGEELIARLVADGVGMDRVQRVAAPTTIAFAEIDPGGTASYRFEIDGTAAPQLTRLPVGADVTTLVTGGLALVFPPMVETVVKATEAVGSEVLVFVDVNSRPAVVEDRVAYLDAVRRVLGRADVVKVSDEDLDVLAPELDVDAMLALGASAVVVTAGARGSAIVTPHGRREVPVAPLPGPVVDTIGAGDTFSAAFVGWWTLAGFGRDHLAGPAAVDRLVDAVRAAGVAAAVTVTRRGCDPPHLADLPGPWPPSPT